MADHYERTEFECYNYASIELSYDFTDKKYENWKHYIERLIRDDGVYNIFMKFLITHKHSAFLKTKVQYDSFYGYLSELEKTLKDLKDNVSSYNEAIMALQLVFLQCHFAFTKSNPSHRRIMDDFMKG